MTTDTIFARSSGTPPAAIGIIRVSGPGAADALRSLAGPLPAPRKASFRRLRAGGESLDEALVLWLPGPDNATGEDCAEFHCHGGRAVLAGVETALSGLPGLRPAEPGEFTRRAFANGRIDLAQAEALADLLSAETEWQRRSALDNVGGLLSRFVEEVRERVLAASALVEAGIDFADEGDVVSSETTVTAMLEALSADLGAMLASPSSERLRDGVRVVLGGPPNAGKSSLFNALLDDSAAIVSSTAGTTRDVIERPLSIRGVPMVLVDTAGLRGEGAEDIESQGIARAQAQLERADIVLWLGKPSDAPASSIVVAAKADLGCGGDGLPVSAVTGDGLGDLVDAIVAKSAALLPSHGLPSANARQREALRAAMAAIDGARLQPDELLRAENLRRARLSLDKITGRAATDDMLDSLFGRFCIGK